MTQPRSRRPATLVVIGLAVILAASLMAYIRWTGPGDAAGGNGSLARSTAPSIESVRRRPHMLFRHTALGDAYGRAVLAPLDAAGSRAPTPLACDRVHYAAGHG